MRTLIVEDDDMNAGVLETALTPFGPCDTAADGAVAVDMVVRGLRDRSAYDLICLDALMPEMDGRQALVEIRRAERDADIPEPCRSRIFMVSPADEQENLFKAFNGQCDAYLSKPVVKKELLKRLHDLNLVSADEMREMQLKA